jgi:TPR repeat protein
MKYSIAGLLLFMMTGVLNGQNTSVFEDSVEEMQYVSDKAQSGDPVALHQMGNYYLNGQIVLANGDGDKIAVSYYRKAAELGYAESQLMLSALYSMGRVVPQNNDSTLYWSTLAALQGQALAQFGLGGYFENGEITEQDYEKSYYWYHKSANQGRLNAIQKMASIYYYGDLGNEPDYVSTVEWATKGSVLGDAFSQRMLGICYFNGQGVDRDLNRASYWMNKARIGGDSLAIELWNNPKYGLENYLED